MCSLGPSRISWGACLKSLVRHARRGGQSIFPFARLRIRGPIQPLGQAYVKDAGMEGLFEAREAFERMHLSDLLFFFLLMEILDALSHDTSCILLL